MVCSLTCVEIVALIPGVVNSQEFRMVVFKWECYIASTLLAAFLGDEIARLTYLR